MLGRNYMLMSHNISVITICFNNLSELIRTIDSVDSQSVKPHQHIIVDGSTNSEIRDYLEQNQHPSYREWISEPDNGIADAFNKGILASSGDIVNMLNSGDCYVDSNVIETVLNTFQEDEKLMWVYGKMYRMKGDQRVLVGKQFDSRKLYRGMRCISHQTMFFKKQLHDMYGLYDTSIRIAMDYDFVCRIASEKSKFIEIPMVDFLPDGVGSDTFEGLKEVKIVYEKYHGKSIKLLFWNLRQKTLHLLLQTKFGLFLNRVKVWLKLENF